MPDLKPWDALPVAGVVERDEALRPRTGTYRTGVKPEVELAECVDCLLCWLYCPDSSCQVDYAWRFTGIDLVNCKGCELCASVCPVEAIEMVAE
jgi:pyruvate ferredoxin oxidoreductase delta subunit